MTMIEVEQSFTGAMAIRAMPTNTEGFLTGSDVPKKYKRPRRSSISCTTFNILAPIFKRIDGEENRESQFPQYWISRNEKILEMLLLQSSSIICLQEFWLESDALVSLYEGKMIGAGYQMYKLPRPNDRGDGLLTAVKKENLTVLDHHELLFNDCNDRVAQFLRLQTTNPTPLQEILLVNTHLVFPLNSNFCLLRLRQVYKILKYLEQYQVGRSLPPLPVLLCGDWNGSKRGQVYRFLRSQGFVSSYDAAHRYTDSDADAHKWVSHRNHRGDVCGVDFIWLLNPGNQRRSLEKCWKEAVFGIIREEGYDERDAFTFFQGEKDSVTYQEFREALNQLGLTEEYVEGLNEEEMKELLRSADVNGNGEIDYEEFQGMLRLREKGNVVVESVGELDVMHASFNAPDVEEGRWPDNYLLSDHAPLTAVFASSTQQHQKPH